MKHVIIPDSGNSLLRKELVLACKAHGIAVTLAHPEHLADNTHPHYLAELASNGPALLFCVNFCGVIGQGPKQLRLKEAIRIMQANGGKVAAWCVDNPWNLLSAMRDPSWKEIALFVTDHSFIPDLIKHKAKYCFHLPLAGCPELFALSQKSTIYSPLVFVGRSSFPEKASYFSGIAIKEELIEKANIMMHQGERPDLLWWIKNMEYEQEVFWPGKKQRTPSFGAEQASHQWRKICLESAANLSLSQENTFSSPPCHLLSENQAITKSHPNKGNSSFGNPLPYPNINASETYPQIQTKCANGTPPLLDIFGDNGWNDLVSNNFRLFHPVDYYEQLPHIYANARYSLALTSMQLPKGINQRHFDVWLAGGFCISDATPGLDLFPKELVQPIIFSRPDTLSKTILSLEAKGEAYRKELINDWKNEIHAKHTYTHRISAVFQALDTIR